MTPRYDEREMRARREAEDREQLMAVLGKIQKLLDAGIVFLSLKSEALRREASR